MTAKKPLAKLILVVSAIISLMEIIVAIMLVISPASVMEDIGILSRNVKFLVYIWASRQLALGIIFGYATFRKSPPMLFISYLFFLAMMIGDIIIGWVLHQNGMAIGGAVMALISISMMMALRRMQNFSNYGIQSR